MTFQDPGRASSDCPFRAHNVLTHAALLRFTGGGPRQDNQQHEFMCECRLPDCEAAISVTLEEFRRLSSNEGCRLVAPDHLDPDTPAATIERSARFWVVRRAGS